MEGVYAALAIVGAVTGYGFSKAKKQSTKKYTLSADDIRVTSTAGAVVDGLFQNSPHKPQSYDCLLNKLPGWVRTKAVKTLELYNQSKASGAPPSVAYTNIRLGLLQDRELGNITASQELYFPKREQFYQWFKECIAAGPMGVQPVTPASARMPRSGSEFTDRSASQFTDRSRSASSGWGGEETPVPPTLMTLQMKRDLLQRMRITDRATFGQWAETRRQTNPQHVADIEAIVNEVFPMTGWTPGSGTGLWRSAPAPAPAPAPLRIAVPETPAATGETPLPTETPVTVPPPAPTVPPPAPTVPPPAPTQGVAPRVSLPPQLPPAPAETVPLPSAPSLQTAETVPLPSAPSAEAVAQVQRQQATPSRWSRLGQAFRAPFTRRNARVVPADAPQTPEAAREFLRTQTPPITDMNSFVEWARQNEGRNPMPVYQAFLRGYPDIPIVFPGPQLAEEEPGNVDLDDIVVDANAGEPTVPAVPSPRGSQSMASRWRTQRARRNLFGRQPPAPAPVPAPEPEPAADFTQINPMIAPAPAPAPAPITREPVNQQARAALFGRQPPAPAVTQRQRPSLLSRLRNVTLRAPRGATPKQNAAKATLDQLGITDVDTFSAYIQGKSSTEQMNALQNGVIAYPDDADLLLDAMTADESGGTAFAQSSDALKKPIQKAADKARKKRPSALVTAPSAISAMTTAPSAPAEGTTPEEIAALTAAPPAPVPQPPPTKVSEIRPATTVGPSYAPVGIPPHMRGLVTPQPSAFVRETPPAPAVTVPPPAPAPAPVPLTVPAPPPSQPRTPEEMEAQLNEIAAAGTGLVAPPPAPEPPSQVTPPLPISAPAPPRRARDAANARKAYEASLPQGFKTFRNQFLTSNDPVPIVTAYLSTNPEHVVDVFKFLQSSAKGRPLIENPDVKQALIRARKRGQQEIRELEELAAQEPGPTLPGEGLIAAANRPLRITQPASSTMQELEDILNAPTPTPATATVPATVSAPPPAPAPTPAPIPPNIVNKFEARQWLQTNLGVSNEDDFRRWIRENTSIVTEPILNTAEVAFPTGTTSGTTNFRTLYDALTGIQQPRSVATTVRRRTIEGSARKNTLRRRRRVNTKNVRRSSYRKNRANRRN